MAKAETVKISLTVNKDWLDQIKPRLKEEGYHNVQEFLRITAMREVERLGWLTKYKQLLIEKDLVDELEKLADAEGISVGDLVARIVLRKMRGEV